MDRIDVECSLDLCIYVKIVSFFIFVCKELKLRVIQLFYLLFITCLLLCKRSDIFAIL